MATIHYGRAARRTLHMSAIVLLTLFASIAPLCAQESAPAPDSTANMNDTSLVMDVRARVMAFTDALDSVYTSIAGTYYGVEPILREGCYDCHSAQTRYPWYYKIPGIKGMIDTDIEQGRKHLDMDKGFPFGGRGAQDHHLVEIKEEMAAGNMPLRSYKLLHWGAAPNDAECDSVIAWIDSSLAAISGVMKRFGVEPPDESAKVVYMCPMDPEVVSSKPGTCPKCGMDLEELTREGERR